MTNSTSAASSCAVNVSSNRVPPCLCTEQFHIAAAGQNIVFIIKPMTTLGPLTDAETIIQTECRSGNISCVKKGREWHVTVPKAQAAAFFDRLSSEHKMSIATLGKTGCIGYKGNTFVPCSQPIEALLL